jgi:hypothetical protein
MIGERIKNSRRRYLIYEIVDLSMYYFPCGIFTAFRWRWWQAEGWLFAKKIVH